MSHDRSDLDSLRLYLTNSAKKAAKQRKKASSSLSHSACLDQIAAITGRANWSLLAKHIDGAEFSQLISISKKLSPQFRAIGIPDFEGGESLMRDWVISVFTPLQDFAFYDSETENGYAWPSVELKFELYIRYGDIFPETTIERVALDLEMSGGPWGLEDYGRTEQDE